MNVGQLKKMLDGVPDDMMVCIPFSHEFDGAFYSPCINDSGVSQMGTDLEMTEEEYEEKLLLNQPIPEVDVFLLVPCGFTEPDENGEKHKHLLN